MGILIYFKQLAERRKLVEKLKTAGEEGGLYWEDTGSTSLSNVQTGPMSNFLNAIGMKFKIRDTKDATAIKLKFLRAGFRRTNVSTVFWGTKVLLAVTFPIVFLVLVTMLFQALEVQYVFLTAVFFIFLGLAVPDTWLRIKTSRRKERITKAFPDALDLLVVCVEAGMGLDAAFNRVGKELGLNHPDLSEEFKLMNLELRAGKPRRLALRNMAERTDIDDVTSLVTVLLQTDRFGTSIAKSLRVFSDSFRTARFQRAEEIAAKMGTKLIFPLALCIFPSLFVVAIGPACIQAYRMFMQ
jgi:tight adherence protein C